jgi:hypothetical protein
VTSELVFDFSKILTPFTIQPSAHVIFGFE